MHIDKIIQKVNRNLNLLKLENKFLNIHAKRLIYFAQIQSHFVYALSVWGNMLSQSVINKLQKLQNKSLQLINGKKATLNNYKLLGILRVQELLELENCKFVYKLLTSSLPPRITEISYSDQTGKTLVKEHKYNTRSKKLLNKAKASNKHYQNCIIYTGTSSLETLKAETKSKPSLQ